MKAVDGGMTLACLTAVSAPRAWTWKTVLPTSRELQLTDTQYRFAARLNLGLQPVEGAATLPATCPICAKPNSIRDDALHFLSCLKLDKEQMRARHDDVARVLHRCALLMGIRAQLEPKHLQKGRLKPDLLLSLPGRLIITDVAVCHPLAAGAVKSRKGLGVLATAKSTEASKRKKYTELASQRRFEQLPFVLETTGGMGPSAVRLVKAMAEASEEHLAVWSKEQVIRELVGSVAIAVQRGGLLTYVNGYDQAVRKMGVGEAVEADGQEVSDDDGEEEEEEAEVEAASAA
jgi:hypothetical protein